VHDYLPYSYVSCVNETLHEVGRKCNSCCDKI